MDFIDIKDNKDDLRQEYGKLLLENNIIYEGECVRGKVIGYGKMIYPNGQFDKGQFFYGKLNGKGKRVYIDGNIYEGEFLEGMEHGEGKITTKAKIGNFSVIRKGKWSYGKIQKKFLNKIKIINKV